MNKIIWLTGESGAGKTTLAKLVSERLHYINLDGDEIRNAFGNDLGFSQVDRAIQNVRVSKLAKTLSLSNNIIVSVIAPTELIREVASDICNPEWVYVKRTLPKRVGHIYEAPENIFTLNHDKLSIEESYNKLIKHIK